MSSHEQNVEVLLSSIDAHLRQVNSRLTTIEANVAKVEIFASKWRRREVIVAIAIGVFLGLAMPALVMGILRV